MKLDSIRVVLVATSHPGNIGATARAMKNMGLSHLYLVNPKTFPDFRAHEMAAGADDILESAIQVESLQEALSGCQLVFGTSARPRGIGLTGYNPRDAAETIKSHADNTQIALVFGREHAGLTNEELLQCHHHINIPSNPEYSSLNLSQAVQILAYEVRIACLSSKIEVERQRDSLARVEEVEQFYNHLQEVLIRIDFLKLSNPKRLLQRLRRLFNRVKLETMEVNILRGILTHIQYAIDKGQGVRRNVEIADE